MLLDFIGVPRLRLLRWLDLFHRFVRSISSYKSEIWAKGTIVNSRLPTQSIDKTMHELVKWSWILALLTNAKKIKVLIRKVTIRYRKIRFFKTMSKLT